MAIVAKQLQTLSIDIGGTGLKMMCLDLAATPLSEKTKVATPKPATPHAIIEALVKMAKKHGTFNRASVGFPGVVKNGIVKTAPNLDSSWANFDLQKELSQLLNVPVRVANDADVQGYGDIQGKGVELVITLGTGMGSALFIDGKLVPNLELGHHPFHKGKTYEDLLGKKALEKDKKEKWNHHLKQAIDLMEAIFNFDTLYIGGGNAKKVSLDLPKNVHLASNLAGLLGGIKLWEINQ